MFDDVWKIVAKVKSTTNFLLKPLGFFLGFESDKAIAL